MLRNRLLTVGLRAGGPPREGLQTAAVTYAGARRRHASSTTTETMGDNRQKTIDDLGGPSFLTTLNWLFVKGYLPKTQQMQVSGARTFPADTCVTLFPRGTLYLFIFFFSYACWSEQRGYLRHHLRVNPVQVTCAFYSTLDYRRLSDLDVIWHLCY